VIPTRRLLALVLAASAALVVPALADAPNSHPCSADPAPGGDWTSYGHDEANSRTQPDESVIGTGNAGQLTAAWVFSTGSTGDSGAFNGTPLVADGCVFTASTGGWVYALDAATGHLVWAHHIAVTTPATGGAIVGGPALWHGRVIVIVNETADGQGSGPYLAAVDEQTGSPVWSSEPLATYAGDYSNATPQVFDGMVFAGYSPPEGDPNGVGGFALVSADDGKTLMTTPTISAADVAKGYAGGGIWSTPAFDPGTKFAYVGAGNPNSKAVEHANTNAILKVDMRDDSPTFGQIVAAYKGNVDQYSDTLQQLSQTPVCSASASAPDPLDDPVCGQLDLDFGASPNLFRNAAGQLLVGDLQKSGVYHVADAATMKPAWTLTAGGTCQACNATTAAVDDDGVYIDATPGGVLWSATHDGVARWASPVGDVVHYQALSTANGVVYAVDSGGDLDAWDASSGAPLLRRPIGVDGQTTTEGLSSAGIAIADHTVFAQVGAGLLSAVSSAGAQSSLPSQLQTSTFTSGLLVAYRLP
jgi:outer membrane protein assembly factor BamB